MKINSINYPIYNAINGTSFNKNTYMSNPYKQIDSNSFDLGYLKNQFNAGISFGKEFYCIDKNNKPKFYKDENLAAQEYNLKPSLIVYNLKHKLMNNGRYFIYADVIEEEQDGIKKINKEVLKSIKEEIEQNSKYQGVYTLSEDGELKYYNNQRECARDLGVKDSIVSRAVANKIAKCRKKIIVRAIEVESKNEKGEWKIDKEKVNNLMSRHDESKKSAKEVYVIKDGKIIKKCLTTNDACTEYEIYYEGMCESLKNYKQYKNMNFVYADELETTDENGVKTIDKAKLKEVLRKIEISMQKKAQKQALYAVDVANNNIMMFDNSKDAANQLGLSEWSITRHLKNPAQTGRKYEFIKAEDIEKIDKKGNRTLDKGKAKKINEEIRKKHSKPVYAIKKDGTYKKYSSQSDLAEEMGISEPNVSSLMNKRKYSQSGYIFVSAKNVETRDENGNLVVDEAKIRTFGEPEQKITGKTSVIVFNNNGFIERFGSKIEASESLNISKNLDGYKAGKSHRKIPKYYVLASEPYEKTMPNGTICIDREKLQSQVGFKISDNQIAQMDENLKSKMIYAIKKDGSYELFKTKNEASQKTNISVDRISRCLTKAQRKTDDYAFVRATEIESGDKDGNWQIDNYKFRVAMSNFLNTNLQRKGYSMDKSGNLESYNMVLDAAISHNVEPEYMEQAIARKLLIDGKYFFYDYEIEGNQENLEKIRQKLEENERQKALYAIPLSGEDPIYFADKKSAAEKLGISENRIDCCLYGAQKKADGYRFVKAIFVETKDPKGKYKLDNNKLKKYLAEKDILRKKRKDINFTGNFSYSPVIAINRTGMWHKYYDIEDASEALGIDASKIADCTEGKLNSVNGYAFKYAAELETTDTINGKKINEDKIANIQRILKLESGQWKSYPFYAIYPNRTFKLYEYLEDACEEYGLTKRELLAYLRDKKECPLNIKFICADKIEIKNPNGTKIINNEVLNNIALNLTKNTPSDKNMFYVIDKKGEINGFKTIKEICEKYNISPSKARYYIDHDCISPQGNMFVEAKEIERTDTNGKTTISEQSVDNIKKRVELSNRDKIVYAFDTDGRYIRCANLNTARMILSTKDKDGNATSYKMLTRGCGILKAGDVEKVYSNGNFDVDGYKISMAREEMLKSIPPEKRINSALKKLIPMFTLSCEGQVVKYPNVEKMSKKLNVSESVLENLAKTGKIVNNTIVINGAIVGEYNKDGIYVEDRAKLRKIYKQTFVNPQEIVPIEV